VKTETVYSNSNDKLLTQAGEASDKKPKKKKKIKEE